MLGPRPGSCAFSPPLRAHRRARRAARVEAHGTDGVAAQSTPSGGRPSKAASERKAGVSADRPRQHLQAGGGRCPCGRHKLFSGQDYRLWAGRAAAASSWRLRAVMSAISRCCSAGLRSGRPIAPVSGNLVAEDSAHPARAERQVRTAALTIRFGKRDLGATGFTMAAATPGADRSTNDYLILVRPEDSA